MRMINPEQARIVKEIVDEKKKNPNDPLCVLVTSGKGLEKCLLLYKYSNL